MNIPKEIIIQIIDRSGNNNPVKNILFGFKIFENENDYYTTSYFKTNNSGSIIIKQSDLINESELKWENDLENFKSSKIQVFPLDALSTIHIRDSSKNYINTTTNKEALKKHLKQSGFTDDNITAANTVINNTATKQMEIYNQFKNSKNDTFEIKTENIEDIWIDNTNKIYKFIITL
jgi:hypothetical protein